MSSDFSRIPRPKLRTREAAAYIGLAKSTLEKLRLTGNGPPYIRIGRVVVYDPDDLDHWLAAHRRLSTSDRAMPDHHVKAAPSSAALPITSSARASLRRLL